MSSERQGVLRTVGDTPLVELQRLKPSSGARIFLKLESFNPTGSYKDRMALSLIEGAEQRGELSVSSSHEAAHTVVEATAGSTGMALAMICAAKGYKFRAITSDAYGPAKLRSMEALGAELEVIKSPTGKITGELVSALVSRAKELGRTPGFIYANQFGNADTLIGSSGIAKEIVNQLRCQMPELAGNKVAFCGAIGTAGMMMGCAPVLKGSIPQMKIIGVEPTSCPVYTAGHGGQHTIDGISPGFEAPHLDRSVVDDFIAIDEALARSTARRLALEEGILAGTSTGLNLAGALRLAEDLGPEDAVITLACDTGLKYLDGPLFVRQA